jgi:hypothetical protein
LALANLVSTRLHLNNPRLLVAMTLQETTPEGLWNPIMSTLLVQTLVQIIVIVASVRFPSATAGALVVAGWPWIYSLLGDFEVGGVPTEAKVKFAGKWVLVVGCATIPILVCKARKANPMALRKMAYWIAVIGAINMMWTFLWHEGVYHRVNIASAIMLIVAMGLRVATLERSGEALAELSADGWLRFRITPVWWALSYSAWNVLWVWKGLRTVRVWMQIFAVLSYMAYAYVNAARTEDIGYDFFFGRSVTLGAYATIRSYRGFYAETPEGESLTEDYWSFLFAVYVVAVTNIVGVAYELRKFVHSMSVEKQAEQKGEAKPVEEDECTNASCRAVV